VAGKVDGLVVMARSLSEADIATLARSVPIVVLANYYVSGGPDFVGADNRGGCREITRHLIREHSYTDLAFLGGPPDSPDSDERFAGFCEALRESGLRVPRKPTASGGFTEAGGRQAVRALLARVDQSHSNLMTHCPADVTWPDEQLWVRLRERDELHTERLPDVVPTDGGTARFDFRLPMPGVARIGLSAGSASVRL
jgi:hypothetical protein